MAYFLAISDTKGSVDAEGFVDWIPLDGFSYEVAFGEVSALTLSVGDSALNFFLESVVGIGPAASNPPEISIVRTSDINPAEVEYRLNLENALFTRLSDSASAGHVVDINFQAIQLETFSANNVGIFNSNGVFGWNAQTGTQTTVDNAAPGGSSTGGGGTVWFMKVDGMDGGSTVAGREGWFELDDFQLDISNFGSSAEFDPVQAAFSSNEALTALFQAMSSGIAITGVQIDGVTYDASDDEHIDQSIILKNVLLTELAHSGSSGAGNQPQTLLAMDYEVITVKTFLPTETVPAATFSHDRHPGAGNGVDTSDPVITVGTGFPGAVTGGNKFFLAATSLEGNSTDPAHAKWFDVNSFDFSMSRSTQVDGSGLAGILYTSPLQISEVSINLKDDSFASQTLSLLGSKSTLTGVTLQATGTVNNVEKTVFQLDLGLVTVNSLADDSGQGVNTTLDFRRIEVETVSYDANGVRLTTNRSGWDTINNVSATVGQAKTGDEFSVPTGELDYFLALQDVPGESTTVGFENWLRISDLSLSAFAPSSIGLPVGSTPPAELGEISLTVHGNNGLARFIELASEGLATNALRIEGAGLAGPSLQTFFILRAGQILVSNVQQLAASGNGEPNYRVTLNVRQLEVSHVNPDTGQLKTGSWNVNSNTSTVTIDNVSPPTGAPTATTGGGDTFYLAINGVRGNSSDAGSAGWFEVMQYSFGVTLPVDSAGEEGQSQQLGLEVLLEFTPAMSTWLKALATGQTFSAATLKSVMSGNNQIGSFVDLAGLKLVSYGVVGSDGGSAIALRFSYNLIEYNFNKFDVGTGLPVPGYVEKYGFNALTRTQTTSDVPGGLPGNGANALPTTAPNVMLINGFNGGLEDLQHGGWFDIESFTMEASAESGPPAAFGEITVTIGSNLGLVDALRSQLLGQTITGVVFDGINPTTGKVLSQIAIGDAVIENISEIEMDGGFSGYEITFSYEVIKVTHFNSSGVAVLPYGWNLVTNTVFTGNIDASPGGTAQADILTGTASNDVLIGLAGNDQLYGLGGNDLLNGGPNDDRIDGGTGVDTVSYIDATGPVTVSFSVSRAQNTGGAGTDTLRNLENIIGSSFGDNLTGNAAANRLEGGQGGDTLNGLGGNDVLIGGLGIDILTGGANADQFVLVKLSGNDDIIQDFEVGIDDIVISASLFGGGLVAGNLNASQFLSGNNGGLATNGGTTATRFVYDSSNGQLFFDSDGTGPAPGTAVIATLIGAPAISASDFLIIA